MEQDITTPLTVRVRGGLILNITYNLTFDETGNLVDVKSNDGMISILSSKLKTFLDSCIGDYTINQQDFTITFTDSRDFMQYHLVEDDRDDEEDWIK
jgi:hypothetical protein